jgi:hypothetical protein
MVPFITNRVSSEFRALDSEFEEVLWSSISLNEMRKGDRFKSSEFSALSSQFPLGLSVYWKLEL